jgi:hypothetical protein
MTCIRSYFGNYYNLGGASLKEATISTPASLRRSFFGGLFSSPEYCSSAKQDDFSARDITDMAVINGLEAIGVSDVSDRGPMGNH